MMSSGTFLSPIKRQKIKKQKETDLKKYMRETLPVYNRNDIRRYRNPYYQAILEELGEQGYTSTKEFFWQLIEYQENLRSEQGPDAPISFKPRLIESPDTIDVLQNTLKDCEEAHYNGDVEKEIDGFVELSVYFGFGLNDWWWLAEQIFLQAVNISDDYQKDGGKRQAIIKYLYGKFLFENMNIREKAKKYLIEARHISIGKDWSAIKQIKRRQETVFVECCNLLFDILMLEAKEIMKQDPLKSARICGIAEKRAIDACNPKAQADALMLQALCEMDAGDANTALELLQKVLALYIRSNQKEGICEARIHIALGFLKIGKFGETKKNLELLLEFARANNYQYYVAQAYRFLGEYYLNQGEPYLATPMLLQAAQIFHEIYDTHNREQAKNLAAISAGQELVPKYAELILNCEKSDMQGFENVMKLVRWKDTRELFWSESIDKTLSNLDFVKSVLHFVDRKPENKEAKKFHESKADSDEKVIEIIQMEM